jgi:hypothetical protein
MLKSRYFADIFSKLIFYHDFNRICSNPELFNLISSEKVNWLFYFCDELETTSLVILV